MRIEFFRNERGYPFARAGAPADQALSGFLDSDVGNAENATQMIGLLQRAAGANVPVHETGNAFTVQAKGMAAVVEFAIDETMAPARLPTRDLISLVEAWRSFLQRGTPQGWGGTDAAPRDALHPPQ